MGVKKDENLSRLRATNLEHVLIKAIESEFPSDGAMLANQDQIISALRAVLERSCVAFEKNGFYMFVPLNPRKHV